MTYHCSRCGQSFEGRDNWLTGYDAYYNHFPRTAGGRIDYTKCRRAGR